MNIIKRQDREENIELLAAQRNVYSRAKSITGLQLFLSAPIAISAAIIAALWPNLKGDIAIWGILVLIFDLFVFTPWTKRLRQNGAKLQELFDTKVLGLDWNEIAAGAKPGPELIHEEANKHGLDKKNTSSLKVWYPSALSAVPEIFGIIICQRTNIWWDATMRRKYSFAIRIFLVFVAVIVMGYGLHSNKDMFLFLTTIVAPLASTYVLGYRQMQEHGEAADRLDRLKESADRLWADALMHKSDSSLMTRCRSLQDQIFEHRSKNPPVFDFLFWMLRAKNSALMNKSAETLVKEYMESQHIQG